MINLIDLLLLILATYRMSEMVAYDSGPQDVFDLIRRWLGVQYHIVSDAIETTEYRDGTAYITELPIEYAAPLPSNAQSGFVAKLIMCMRCNSVYLALVVLLLFLLSGTIYIAYILLLVLALSGAVTLLRNYAYR